MSNSQYIAELYNSGKSIKQVSVIIGCNPTSIRHALKKEKVTMRASGGKVTFDVDEAIRLYVEDGHPMHKIADIMQVNTTAIFEQFKKKNIDTTRFSYDREQIKQLLSIKASDREICEKIGISLPQLQKIRIDEFGIHTASYYHNIKNVINFCINNKQLTFNEFKQKFEEVSQYTTLKNIYLKYNNNTCITLPQSLKELRQDKLNTNRVRIIEMIQSNIPMNSMLTEMNIPQSMWKNWLIENNIDYNYPGFHIKHEYYEQLTNKEWMEYVISDPFVTTVNVSEKYFNNEVGVDQIRFYFNKLGLSCAQRPIVERFPKLLDKEFLIDSYKTRSLLELADLIGCSHPTVKQMFDYYNIPVRREHSISKIEKQILEVVKTLYDGKIIENDRVLIGPKEVDILLPDLNLAIECCGIYWHSEKYKPNNYHLNKMKLVNDKNVRLLTIFEDEWTFKRNVVISKLKQVIGCTSDKIFARKCKIEEIDNTDAQLFTDTYHLQGSTKSSIRIGLTYDDQLVALMLFKQHNEGYELTRFSSSCNIVGGFSKILSYFIERYSPKYITTFADLRWSDINNNVYLTNNFKQVHITPPLYYYYDYASKKLKHRSNFTRTMLEKKLGDKFDPQKTERQNANAAGFYAVYNCGLVKYVLEVESTIKTI